MGNFFHGLLLGSTSNLPDLGQVENWWLNIVVQAVTIIVIYLVAKNLARLRIGGIITCILIGGAVVFVIQNFSQVTTWVESIIELL